MKKNYKTIGIIAILIIIVVFLVFNYIKDGKNQLKKNNTESIFVEDDKEESTEVVAKNTNKIVVEIKGEIKKPDIYWLSEENIIDDLIKIAGGLTEKGDISTINRAEKLKNHQLIMIPSINDAKKNTDNIKSSNSNLINLNTATEAELDTLPGIGPSRVKEIIKYREEKGGFNSIEDLKNIKGIGTKSFEELKDRITV